PEKSLPEASRKAFEAVIGQYSLLIAGHLHYDAVDGKHHIVRGLDPDKAIGGVPALVIFEQDANGSWLRREIEYSAADPAGWTKEEQEDFLDHLGLSGMYETIDVLKFATDEKVKCFEIRYQAFGQYPFEELDAAVKTWRASGGTHLSLHLPDIGWRDGAVSGAEKLRDAAEQGIAVGCDRMTLHVPGFSVGTSGDPAIYQAVLHKTAEVVERIVSAGVRVGIENMHMTPREKPDKNRGFGYTTAECLRWINDLKRLVSVPENVGFHFDIGHARNNAPYSSLEPVSSWLAAAGKHFNGMHLHQIKVQPDGSLENHTPLLQLYQPLISLASLFLAWRTGAVKHAPMFLEIRGGTGPESLLALRGLIKKN
ncbi:MAG: TIM barrel protein, partial [Lentisphaeria bacterium]|nr:TIM barrel protein [Lentisphaeria bacterium]